MTLKPYGNADMYEWWDKISLSVENKNDWIILTTYWSALSPEKIQGVT